MPYIYPSVLQALAGRGYAGRGRGRFQGHREADIQHSGYELPRIPIPRTRVNKARRRTLSLYRHRFWYGILAAPSGMREGRRQRVSLTDKELWTTIHGMALGALFVLASVPQGS